MRCAAKERVFSVCSLHWVSGFRTRRAGGTYSQALQMIRRTRWQRVPYEPSCVGLVCLPAVASRPSPPPCLVLPPRDLRSAILVDIRHHTIYYTAIRKS